MTDLLMKFAPQFVTITLIAMFLTELLPIKWIGKMADKEGTTALERNGTRRPLSALIYAYGLSLLAWGAGVVHVMADPPAALPVWLSGAMFLAIMSISNVVTAHFAVKIKKVIKS